MTDFDGKKILVITPAYNEEKSIRNVVDEIKSLYPSLHLLVVNDGSSDATALEAQRGGAGVVTLPFNLGIGGAVQTGIKIAERLDFEAVIQIDGDGQHDPRFIRQVLQPVLEGKLDLCIGSRFLTEDPTFQSTFARRIGIRFFCLLLRGLTGQYLTDPTSGFRASSRKLIKIFSDDYPVDFPEPEAIKIAKRHHSKIGEVAVKMRKREKGKSSIRHLATLYYMIKVTFAILIDTLRPED